jgi:hypothetical protein
MQKGVIKFNPVYAEALKGIAWKDINTKFKNDFDKTAEYVHEILREKGIIIGDFYKEVEDIYKQIEKLNLSLLGIKVKPPEGY